MALSGEDIEVSVAVEVDHVGAGDHLGGPGPENGGGFGQLGHGPGRFDAKVFVEVDDVLKLAADEIFQSVAVPIDKRAEIWPGIFCRLPFEENVLGGVEFRFGVGANVFEEIIALMIGLDDVFFAVVVEVADQHAGAGAKGFIVDDFTAGMESSARGQFGVGVGVFIEIKGNTSHAVGDDEVFFTIVVKIANIQPGMSAVVHHAEGFSAGEQGATGGEHGEEVVGLVLEIPDHAVGITGKQVGFSVVVPVDGPEAVLLHGVADLEFLGVRCAVVFVSAFEFWFSLGSDVLVQPAVIPGSADLVYGCTFPESADDEIEQAVVGKVCDGCFGVGVADKDFVFVVGYLLGGQNRFFARTHVYEEIDGIGLGSGKEVEVIVAVDIGTIEAGHVQIDILSAGLDSDGPA